MASGITRPQTQPLSDPERGISLLSPHSPGHANNFLSNQTAAEYTGNRTQAGPGAIPDQPEAIHTHVIRDRPLVSVSHALPHPADRALWTARVFLVSERRTYLVDDRVLPQVLPSVVSAYHAPRVPLMTREPLLASE